MSEIPETDNFEVKESEQLKAALSPSRIKILHALAKGPASTRLISESTELSRSLVNHHIQILVKNSLVKQRGNKSFRYYELTDEGRARLGLLQKGGQAYLGYMDSASRYLPVYILALVVLSSLFAYSNLVGEPQPLWTVGFIIVIAPLVYMTIRGLLSRLGVEFGEGTKED